MPVTAPIVPYGLSESIDIFFVKELRNLLNFYTNQQGETKKIDCKAVWTKGDVSSYPFLGVMTHIPKNEPVAFSDDFGPMPNENQSNIYKATINNAEIGLSIQAIELREVARLREFITLNLERGNHPQTNQPWRLYFLENNVNLLYEEYDPPEEVDLRTILMRTRMAQGQETLDRTDIETLWVQDMRLCAQVQFNVPLITTQGIINGIDLNLTLDVD